MSTDLTMSRRSILTGLFATSCLTLVPLRARAEPMTVLAAGAAVVGIISGVAGVLSDSRKEKILNEINGKLDVVIRNQEIILAEIQSLKMYIDEALYRSFRENTIVRMNGHQDRYEVLITERPNSTNRSEYVDLEAAVSQTAFELGQFDTPAYIAFGAGVGMTLAIHQAVGLSKDRFKKLKEVFKRPYDHWLDPSNPKSITVIVATTASEIDARTKALLARPRSVSSVNYRGLCTETTVTTITGDLKNGFSGSNAMSRECRDPPDPCDRHPNLCPTSLGDEYRLTEIDVGKKLLGYLEIASVADTTEVPIPQFQPSGIGVVDEMNRERIAIFELMNLKARQEVVKEQMEKCRTALSQ